MLSSFILLPVIILVVIAVWVILTYNTLIKSKVRTEEAWADIDVQLKRRYDLIPNLVETVKGYARHEQQTFQKVIEARAKAMSAQTVKEKAEAENMLSNTLKSIFALAENYPELKASENFLNLQEELTDTENKIQASRRFYNGNVRDFNTKVKVFPTNILANLFKFKELEFFELEEEAEAREPVEVKF